MILLGPIHISKDALNIHGILLSQKVVYVAQYFHMVKGKYTILNKMSLHVQYFINILCARTYNILEL